MPTYKNLPRGKQKPHDEFKDWTMHVLIWIKNNWQGAVELAGVAVVAFALVLGASSYWKHRSMTAAERLYSAERKEAGGDEQIKALDEIIDSYARTPAGQQAMMMLGNMYYDRKEYDKAKEMFRMLQGRSRNHAIMQIAALHSLAEAELAGGDALAAAETYLKAAANPHNIISIASRLRAASCFEKAGDFKKAEQLYRQVIDDSKEEDRAVREKSEERLIWLMANHQIEG